MSNNLDLASKPSARCGLRKQLLDSCPGEREMSATSDNNMELLMTSGQITGTSMYLTGRDLRSQRWGEHFQDLSGWCQPNKSVDMLAPQSDEQLNTPIISAQDEFDFGVRSSEERLDALMSEMECDPWEVTTTSLTSTNSLTNTTTMEPHTQKELWDSVDIWLSSNSPEQDPEFEEIIPPQQPASLEFHKRQIVKANGDFLLSQSPVDYQQIKTEESSINFSPYLTATSSPEDHFNKTVNNNNNYLELTPYTEDKSVVYQLICPAIKNEGNIAATSIKNETTVPTTCSNILYNRHYKRECSFDLTSLLKSEEPFINDMDSETSCNNLSPECNKVSSPIVISGKDDDVVAEEVVVTTDDSYMVKQEDTIITTSSLSCGNIVKTEMDTNPLRYSNNSNNIRQHHQQKLFKPPTPTRSPQPQPLVQETARNIITRPKLKLDIDAALMSTQTESLDTPEVLKPLVDGIDGFNLLSYVCDDGAMNLLSTSAPSVSSSVYSQPAISSSMTTTVAPLQEKKRGVGRPPGRYQPKTGKKGRKIKEEIVKEVEELPRPLEELTPSGRPKRKSAESFKSSIKQRRLTDDTDDLESLSSIDTGAYSDDSDESFSTKSRPGRKRKLSKSSSKSGSIRKRKTSDSDHDSVFSGSDRYRELRDRNNEASRRSRLNRKSREMEMRDQAIQLEKDNRLLKLKADEMERLVKKLRENLMQLVLKR